MINVIVCDHHPLIRQGVCHVLANEFDLSLAGEAASYSELRQLLKTTPCDVLLLELNLTGRDGFDVMEMLQRDCSQIRVLMLSAHPSEVYALRCIRAGAWGYLNKSCQPAELINAIGQLGRGRKYVSTEVADLLLENMSSKGSGPLHEALSKRELQTLKLLAQGKRITDIGELLMLSVKTVSVYRRRILDKLKLSSNGELIGYAIYHRLL